MYDPFNERSRFWERFLIGTIFGLILLGIFTLAQRACGIHQPPAITRPR